MTVPKLMNKPQVKVGSFDQSSEWIECQDAPKCQEWQMNLCDLKCVEIEWQIIVTILQCLVESIIDWELWVIFLFKLWSLKGQWDWKSLPH